MQKLTWGVLGCSDFARRRTIPALLEAPAADLTAIASRTREKAERFRAQFNLRKAYDSYDGLVNDPDIQAVYIPLPNGLHAEWTIKAMQQGKHVLCEKPFTSNAQEALRVRDAATAAGVSVMEAFMWRLHPQHHRALEAVRAGEIGEVALLRSSFSYTIASDPNVRLDPCLTGGSVMDVGCYPISAARFYFQGEPSVAFARTDVDSKYRVDMRMTGMLVFPGGRALIDSGFTLPYRTDLEIVGEKGSIRIPKPWLPDPQAAIEINGKTETLPEFNQYVGEFEHFSTGVLKGERPRYGPEDAILQMRVIDAVMRSSETGNPEPVV